MERSNDAWIAMFRRIPANFHDVLAVTLRTGTEIVIQKIFKVEPDFAILRGRISGTQDLGRVVMIPFDQMTFLSITRPMKDPEVEGMFGNGAAAAAESEAGMTETPPETEFAEEPEAPAPKLPEQMSKTALVAKLRERLKESK